VCSSDLETKLGLLFLDMRRASEDLATILEAL